MNIGLFAPSAAITPDELENAVQSIRSHGFSVTMDREFLLNRKAVFAGSARQKAEYFYTLVKNPDVDWILSMRGGSGAVHLLNELSVEGLKSIQAKPIMGFSDVSGLLNFLTDQCGWLTYHGPNLRKLGELDSTFVDAFWNHLKSGKSNYSDLLSSAEILQAGTATGKLAGGNLATLASLCGTPWQVNAKDKILILEDVNEAPYQLERMISQLEYSGSLNGIKGLLLGEFSNQGRPMEYSEYGFALEGFLSRHSVPLAVNLPFGHGKRNSILPIGKEMKLDTSSRTLTTQAS